MILCDYHVKHKKSLTLGIINIITQNMNIGFVNLLLTFLLLNEPACSGYLFFLVMIGMYIECRFLM